MEMITKELNDRVLSLPVQKIEDGDVVKYIGINNSGKTTRMMYDILEFLQNNKDKKAIIVTPDDLKMVIDLFVRNVKKLRFIADILQRVVVVDSVKDLKTLNLKTTEIILALDDHPLLDLELLYVAGKVKSINKVYMTAYN